MQICNVLSYHIIIIYQPSTMMCTYTYLYDRVINNLAGFKTSNAQAFRARIARVVADSKARKHIGIILYTVQLTKHAYYSHFKSFNIVFILFYIR